MTGQGLLLSTQCNAVCTPSIAFVRKSLRDFRGPWGQGGRGLVLSMPSLESTELGMALAQPPKDLQGWIQHRIGP